MAIQPCPYNHNHNLLGGNSVEELPPFLSPVLFRNLTGDRLVLQLGSDHSILQITFTNQPHDSCLTIIVLE